ncbi:MAG TPA: hypothetical protein VKE69_00220 [Planctomycetota bacterium]|nr:hypothetical protein [Planctomycetota bacterium]
MSFLNRLFGSAKCRQHPESKFQVAVRSRGDEKKMCEVCYGEELKAAWPASPKTPIVMAEFSDGVTALTFVARAEAGSTPGKWKDLASSRWTLAPGTPCAECKLPASGIWLTPDETVRGYGSNVDKPLMEHHPVPVCGNCAADRIVNGIRDHDLTELAANVPTDDGGILVPS